MSASHAPEPGQPQATPVAEGAADPSMEDILASIRRILSEDEAEAPAPAATGGTVPAVAAPVATANEPHGHDDVLDLDASMIVEEPEGWSPPAAVTPHAAPPPAIAEALPAAVAPPEPAAPPPRAAEPAPMPMRAAEPLVAPAAAAAAANSVGELLRSVVAGREQVAVHRGGPTIEDLVREEIRPLLKQWLDAHLPPLVERLVRAEMERVVGRVS